MILRMMSTRTSFQSGEDVSSFFMALINDLKVYIFEVVLFFEPDLEQGLVESFVGYQDASERVAGFCSPMYAYSGPAFYSEEQWHGFLEPWREGYEDFVGAGGDDVVGVFECGRKGAIFGASLEVAPVDESVDGFPFWFFSIYFVKSHSFFVYAASMPKSAPAKVATSPNPMSSDSWICPCGSI